MSDPKSQSTVPVDSKLSMSIAGMYVVRSMCNPIRHGKRREEAQFRIGAGYAEAPGEGTLPALVGQVVTNTSNGSHMIAITVMAVCYPGTDEQMNPKNIDELNNFLRKWGNWGAHPIWDFCSIQIRMMAAGLQNSDLILTKLTPEPELNFLEPDAENSSDSD